MTDEEYADAVVNDAIGIGIAPLAAISGKVVLSTKRVYRVIRPNENLLDGLSAKNPLATYKVEGHVLNGSRPRFESQYISTTTDLSIARDWAERTGNRMAEIDLSKVEGRIIDLSTETGRNTHLKGNTAKNFANASSELLIEGFVPAEGVKLVP